MKLMLLMVITSGLLCGCPDSKLPKAPPHVPAPKLAPWPASLPLSWFNATDRLAGPIHRPS